MPKITYQLVDGSSRTIEALAGENVKQIALDNNIEGVVGRCGGFCNCGTCHVYVDEKWVSILPAESPEEDEMLFGTSSERLSNSRLSCQIKLTEELDGIVVSVPESQE